LAKAENRLVVPGKPTIINNSAHVNRVGSGNRLYPAKEQLGVKLGGGADGEGWNWEIDISTSESKNLAAICTTDYPSLAYSNANDCGCDMALVGTAASGWLRKPGNNEAVVVFVHGIISDGIQCWMAPNGRYWPALLAADMEANPALQNAGIFIFSYKTSVFSKTYSLGDIVDNLAAELGLQKIVDFQRIIFVCHSMGGIVVRRYLVREQLALMKRKTQFGLFFVASPSLGSVHANLLYPLIGLLRNSQAKILRFSQQNQWLNDLDKDFIKLLDSKALRITGKELVEDVPIQLARWRCFRITLSWQTVPPYAAAKYFVDSFKVPDASHITICKPKDATEIQHRLLVEFVSKMLAAPHAPITLDMPRGWIFANVAKELVKLDKNGAILNCDALTTEERSAGMEEKRIVASTIEEALEVLRLYAAPRPREYRVEHIGREYRLVPN
jgi:pimeloyl-ACP methyl ester carboxylesterase